jgi:hypothetical protein
MGTTTKDVAANYSAKAEETRQKIDKMNSKFLVKYINETLNITISPDNLDTDLGFNITERNYTSLYQEEDQLMFIV